MQQFYNMPKLLIIKNIVFLIFSVDFREERKHIHFVKKAVRKFNPAKIWLEPNIEISEKGDFNDVEINKIIKLVIEYKVDRKSVV